MGLKYNYIKLSEIKNDIFLRLDVDYFQIKNKLNIDKNIKLRKYLTFLETGKPITPDDYTDNSNNIHIVVRNIVDGCFNSDDLIYINDIKGEELSQYRLKKGDIVIGISSNCGYSFLYDWNDKRNLTLSHYLARFRVDSNYINSIYLNYYINSSIIKQYFRSVETGKTLKNLSKYYIKSLPLLIPNLSKQNSIIKTIYPVEKNISELKSYIIPETQIINNVFSDYFNFDIENFNKLKKIKKYFISFSLFSNNRDLRQSVKFHRKSGKFVFDELKNITSKKIKDFISEPIILGKSISPEDYDENEDFYYISMFDIKSWYFNKENCKTISKNYYTSNQNKTVKKNDIILARSGEGTIGKVSIINDDDISGIFADFTMRIRVKDCNPTFIYYYFRTEYFQYLVEINKKGLGNNTNIFPSQLQEFPMIDIPIKDQNRIVKNIETEIKKQNEIIKNIESERKKIDEIIISSIK